MDYQTTGRPGHVVHEKDRTWTAWLLPKCVVMLLYPRLASIGLIPKTPFDWNHFPTWTADTTQMQVNMPVPWHRFVITLLSCAPYARRGFCLPATLSLKYCSKSTATVGVRKNVPNHRTATVPNPRSRIHEVVVRCCKSCKMLQ